MMKQKRIRTKKMKNKNLENVKHMIEYNFSHEELKELVIFVVDTLISNQESG